VRHLSFQIAESMGFKGDFRQWQDLLRIGDRRKRVWDLFDSFDAGT
jgi:hypothetical protein